MRLVRRFRDPNVWIPSVFFGMFALIILANAAMIYVGFITWRGTETRSAYAAGQVYNARLEEQERVRELGWTLDAAVTDQGGQRAGVEVRFTGPEGEDISAETLRIAFVRPTQSGHDIVRELPQTAPGVYSGAVDLPLPGLWELRMAARRHGLWARASQRVTLEP